MKWNWLRDNLIFGMLIVNGVVFTLQVVTGISIPLKSLLLIASVFIVLVDLYMGETVGQIKAIIGLAFLGNEVFFMVLLIVIVPKILMNWKKFISINQVQRVALIFFAYALILLVVTNLIDFSFFTIIFWLIMFGLLFPLFIFFAGYKYSTAEGEEVFRFLSNVIKLQVLILLMQAVIHRNFTPGDFWSGSAGNSIIVGFYFALYLMACFIKYFVKLDRPIGFLSIVKSRFLPLAFVMLIMMYFNDSKLIIACFVVAGILYFSFIHIIRFFRHTAVRHFFMMLFSFVVIFVLFFGAYRASILYLNSTTQSTEGFASLSYYADDKLDSRGLNAKYLTYVRMYSRHMSKSFGEWLFGVGPGKFGSKTSNLLAYDVLYKTESQTKLPEFIPPYSSKAVREYLANLWTEDIVKSNMYRSVTLSMPFAGLITIKAEYGLVGLVLFLTMVMTLNVQLVRRAETIRNWKLKDWSIVIGLFWFALPFQMIFDNFQEMNFFMVPMLLLTAVIIGLQEEPDEALPIDPDPSKPSATAAA